ncbi:unnamed protein product [Peronospora destructor]|uniref:Nudix hydrolase domain-containing protein n=1 Tax=Peronospora destructor TaxID=86335 RepID=A0AAV0SZ62_9STRA|nr:unnamed protein product [Peronospora destructor]
MGLFFLMILTLFLPSCAGVYLRTFGVETSQLGTLTIFLAMSATHGQGRQLLRQYDFDTPNMEERTFPLNLLAEHIAEAEKEIDISFEKLLNTEFPEKVWMEKPFTLPSFGTRLAEYEKLSPDGQLKGLKFELQRSKDWLEMEKLFSKDTPAGMRRNYGDKEVVTAPKGYLSSNPRGSQKMENGMKVMVYVTVLRNNPKTGQLETLIISSSNPAKLHFIGLKGGVETTEDIASAALRECGEEGGIRGRFLVESTEIWDDYAESSRLRDWFVIDDAKILLSKRKDMVEALEEAVVAWTWAPNEKLGEIGLPEKIELGTSE